MVQVSVQIVTWNSMKYLPTLMASFAAQTFRDFSILVIDNASSDGTVEFLRQKYPEVTILRNFRNLGFSAAHNQGIKYALAAWKDITRDDRYVLVTNPDVIFTPTFLENLVTAAETRPEAAAFGGKLLRVSCVGEDGMEEEIRTKTIDSTGLRVFKSRRLVDRGAGEEDTGQYDDNCEVFGVSGALAMYRASALEVIKVQNEYFDEDFFAYKEDGDLAWRLRLSGFSARYVPPAVAYHFRRAAGKEKAKIWEFLRNRRTKSNAVNQFSYRNHLLMLVKNEQWGNLIRHLPWIGVYEGGKFFSLIFWEPKTLRAVINFWRFCPRMMEKRGLVMAKRRVSAQAMRKWFE